MEPTFCVARQRFAAAEATGSSAASASSLLANPGLDKSCRWHSQGFFQASMAVVAVSALKLLLAPARGVGARRLLGFSRRTSLASESPSVVLLTKSALFSDWADWLLDYFAEKFDLIDDADAPPEYLRKTGRGNATITTRVLTGRGQCPVRRLRVTLVSAGDQTQALNMALYPDPELGPLPLLGVDIIALNSGKRLLFGTDWAPASPDSDYHAQRIAPFIDDVRADHADILMEPSARFYGEWPEFFSRSMFFSRPDSVDQLEPGSRLWGVFQAYCQRYADMLTKVVPDAGSESYMSCRRRQDDYDCWHAERDPAMPIFKMLFGDDWTHAMVTKVLFPGMANRVSTESAEQAV